MGEESFGKYFLKDEVEIPESLGGEVWEEEPDKSENKKEQIDMKHYGVVLGIFFELEKKYALGSYYDIFHVAALLRNRLRPARLPDFLDEGVRRGQLEVIAAQVMIGGGYSNTRLCYRICEAKRDKVKGLVSGEKSSD